MPKESLNIYMTVTDQISPVLASITDKTRALDKESQELQQTYEALQKANRGLIERKTELQKKLQEVNEEVKEARKQFKELGDEASSDAYIKAQERQQKLRNEIAATTKSLQENQKIYKENIETIRKNDVGGAGASLSDVMAGLNIGEELSSLALTVSGALASSALGSDMGDIVSKSLGSAISGGAAGAMFGLPGIALGTALGGVSGLISGGTKIFEAKDDAFKDYYGGLYDDVKSRSGEMVESGSTIAGGREQTRMAFSRRLGGEDAADDYLAQVERMAADTNYDYDEIVGYAKLLLNSYDPGDVLGVLRDLSDATAGLDLSSGDVNMMIAGLSRMRTTGKATQEYLNYFRERGIDADAALADSLGVDKSAVSGMVTEGKVSGEDAAEALLEYIRTEFGGLSEGLASTYDAMVDNLGDITATLEARGGDAYNELRKEGVGAEMEALGGELGDAIGEINAIIGENQARRENLQDQYMR
ncbi:MAG: tape measure protein [Oscillospiraceae bacterium]